METVFEKLKDLYDEEWPLENRAEGLRSQQIDLCEKELLKRCFKITRYAWEKAEKEECVCFTGVRMENKYGNVFFLTAIVVCFENIDGDEDFGVTIQEKADPISEWLEDLKRGTEITLDDFKKTQQRAFSYLYNLSSETIE